MKKQILILPAIAIISLASFGCTPKDPVNASTEYDPTESDAGEVVSDNTTSGAMTPGGNVTSGAMAPGGNVTSGADTP